MSVNRLADGTWQLASKQMEMLGRDIARFTAAAPTGPFTQQSPALASLPPGEPNEGLYIASTHPQAALSNGNLLVTYCRNNFSFDRLLRDADYYAIQFMEVPLRPGSASGPAPDGIAVTPGDGTATLTWTPPSPGQGVVSQQVVAEPGHVAVQVAADAATAVVRGLRNWQPYSLHVRAVTADGAGQPSLVVVTTPSPIRAYAGQHPDVMQPLGEPRSGEYPAAGGRVQEYTQGALFWRPGKPVFAMTAPNAPAYLAAGGPGGKLGWPVANQQGPMSSFEHGLVYTGRRGTHALSGNMASLYLFFGGPTGPLGHPASDNRPSGGDWESAALEAHSIYSSPTRGPGFSLRPSMRSTSAPAVPPAPWAHPPPLPPAVSRPAACLRPSSTGASTPAGPAPTR